MPSMAGMFLYKLAWGGQLFGTDEWSNSLHIQSSAAVNNTASDFVAALTPWYQQGASNHNAATTLDYVKFNRIDHTTGKYEDQGASDTHLITPPLNVIAGDAAPAQLALAVTLGTPIQRGRGSKGRIFIPVGGAGVDGDGLINLAFCQALAEHAKTMVNAVNAVVDPARVCVFSKVGQLFVLVNHVKVGRVLDTQRRRRSSLDENYQVAMLA